MTARYLLPWSDAGYTADPIPGSPTGLDDFMTTCDHTATICGDVAARLRALRSFDNTVSDAVQVILAKADETATGLDAAQDRYEVLSSAMKQYRETLANAQTDSEAAVRDAQTALTAYWNHRERLAQARKDLNSADQTVRAGAQTEITVQTSMMNSAWTDRENAIARIEAAIQSRDEQARATASSIDQDLRESPLNDGFWDKFCNFFSSIANWIWENIDAICLVLDLLALILALTGVGGPIAAVLLAVSKVARAVSTIKTVVNLYTAVSTGNLLDAALIAGGWLLGKGLSAASSKLVEHFGSSLMQRATTYVGNNTPGWLSGPIKAFNQFAGTNVGRLLGPITGNPAGAWLTRFTGSHLGLSPLRSQAGDGVASWLGDLLGFVGAEGADAAWNTTSVDRVLERAI